MTRGARSKQWEKKMNRWQYVAIAGVMAAATVLLAADSLAAGGGNGRGPQYRAGQTNVRAVGGAASMQTRQRLRDGSCVQPATAGAPRGPVMAGAGDRLRLRDGSCLTK